MRSALSTKSAAWLFAEKLANEIKTPTLSLGSNSGPKLSPKLSSKPATGLNTNLTTSGSGLPKANLPKANSAQSSFPQLPSMQDMGNWAQNTGMRALNSTPGQAAIHGLSQLGAAYDRNVSPQTQQTLGDMSANSARTAGGMLSTVAGGLGVAGSGLAAGANAAWNSVTPKSMNTSPVWTAGVNNAFNKSVDFTNAGARDVYGSLGGDTNYDTQHSWNQIEQGYNDPNVAPWAQNTAAAAGWAGHGAWNYGTALADPSKMVRTGPALVRNLARGFNTSDTLASLGELGHGAASLGSGVNQAMNASQEVTQ